MTRKELQKISIQYRTLSSQMLKMSSQDEMYCIQQYYDFINKTPFLHEYIETCTTEDYDFQQLFAQKDYGSQLELPSNQQELISYGYQLIQYILDGPKQLIGLCIGYTGSRKFSDNIEAFVRKTIEPFVVALKTHIELEYIDVDEGQSESDYIETIFLSYCQKDRDIADAIEENLSQNIEGKAKISRDIRDVEYHGSFKAFMQSIEKHDYVISVISDNYLKSRNCMYEMLEVVKDSHFAKRLLFVVLTDADEKFYKEDSVAGIRADVYSSSGQAEYIKYWRAAERKLETEIEEIGDTTYAIAQIKELGIVKRILLDLPEFFEFIRDNKGLSFSEHLEHGFSDMKEYMKI